VKIASHQPQLSTLPGLKTALRGGGTRGSSTIIPGPPGGSNDTRGGGGYTHTHTQYNFSTKQPVRTRLCLSIFTLSHWWWPWYPPSWAITGCCPHFWSHKITAKTTYLGMSRFPLAFSAWNS